MLANSGQHVVVFMNEVIGSNVSTLSLFILSLNFSFTILWRPLSKILGIVFRIDTYMYYQEYITSTLYTLL